MLSKRAKNKCQEIYYSNNVCMMQSSLGELVVIAMVKEGFNFVGTIHWADEERMGARRKCFAFVTLQICQG